MIVLELLSRSLTGQASLQDLRTNQRDIASANEVIAAHVIALLCVTIER